MGVPLKWNRWATDEINTATMSATFWSTTSLQAIFWDAMRLLFYDEAGNPGLLYKGMIYPKAQEVMAWNSSVTYGFSDTNLVSMLQQGAFHYEAPIGITYSTKMPRLQFVHPDPAVDASYYGKASVPGHDIMFNPWVFLQKANELNWPKDATGVDRLKWKFASVILHEVMHNHGFSHPKPLNYAAQSCYACSLPFVAERAVAMASPYWAEFESYYTQGLWLVPGSQEVCGTY